ncbi:putative benzoate 4-monooxygenase cytochrome P450 [Lineolata rhizophorae]|uniref:Putative benzoate 4-monooxygenase cytochrome P450 n=1 Tax=Lineolata rhizophorae TaxID=578093 RepID=A0A6A6NL75_9PEZI|nr:putative benzoate 4-monooxygenase cytochrome P450 [Lineolata rhizophorae]
MEPPSPLRLAVPACLAFLAYVLCLYVYRLFFHPLARFPGPKLAALSNWYEFYHEVVLQGKFTAHVKELHKQYGPIIRITPSELHIDDPEYYDQLYARAGRRDKYSYFSGRFGYASDSFSTVHHDLHRLRRKALSPMFSAKRISEFQPVIREKVDKLCQKFTEYQKDGKVLALNRPWMALTTDIITEYAFARAYDQLDSPDFQDTLHEALVAIYTTGQFALHFPIVFPILDMLPDWFVLRAQPVLQPVVGLRKDLARKVDEIRRGINDGHKAVAHPTIFHELLLNADLPEPEKSNARLGDEAQLIVAAGLITTSWALTVASYHIAADRRVYLALRAELAAAGVTGAGAEERDWHKLEALPYLGGCVREAIRLAHGVSTRSPRLAPETELRYADWVIPRNTPVSMTNAHVLMNDAIFPEPRTFRPERWVDDPALERFFVPFSKGSRQCLGLLLAQAELYVTIATVYSRFEFELVDTDVSDVEMKHAYLVPYPKWDSKGVQVKIKSAPQ